MPKAIHFTWAALAVAAGVTTSVNALATDARSSPNRAADRMLAALVKANGVPGMGASVVVDGVPVWHGSAGMRNLEAGEPVDRHTMFRLASVSKLVTATAAAKLGEDGRLDLDAPVQSRLPWLKATWAPLTPRQLTAHTSGLPHYQDVDKGRGTKRYESVRAAVGIFDDRPLLAAPNTAYQYSSWGYTLLSAVIEAGAGKSFLDYIAHEVTPGLAIGPDASDHGDPKASKAYGFTDGRAVRLPAHDMSYTWGGGGLAATPEAIALFGSRVMDGKVVSPNTFNAMLEPARLADGSVVGERDYKVGFGWRTGLGLNGERLAHHAGVTGGARSALVLWPSSRVSASVLSNAQWTSSIETTAEMLAAPFLQQSAAGGQPTVRCPVDALAYEGEFQGERFRGSATFSGQAGLCTGQIKLPQGLLRTWLNGFPQRDADSLEIIGIRPGAGISRAALVTPIGLHDLRPDANGQTLRVRFDANRSLVIRLTAAQGRLKAALAKRASVAPS